MARVIISDGSSQREVELVDPITIAGRSSENKIHLEDKQASRKHCQFEKTDFGFKLVDLESRNGTRVNDRVVNQALLRPGDRVSIGKFTLTFEDATFKEPSGEVAARFAPPAAPAGPIPAPPAKAAPASASPAPPSPAPLPAPPPEPRIRRRTSSGNTTAIVMQRTERFERMREQQMLRWVGVGAAVFIVVLVILIVLPGGGGAPVEKTTASRASGGDTKRTGPSLEDEQHDFETLQEFCDRNLGNPPSFGRVRDVCNDFKRRYPNSLLMPQVQAYLNKVSEAQRGAFGKEADEGIAAAREEARKGQFAAAVKRLKTLAAKVTDVEANNRIVKAHDEIVDQGVGQFNTRHGEAKGMATAGKKDEAIKVYEALLGSFSDAAVDEFNVQVQIARKELEGLR